MRWTSNLTDTTGPFEGNHNADAAHNEIEFDTPCPRTLMAQHKHLHSLNMSYSGTSDYEHNPFQENARNPKYSHIKASFSIEVNEKQKLFVPH